MKRVERLISEYIQTAHDNLAHCYRKTYENAPVLAARFSLISHLLRCARNDEQWNSAIQSIKEGN
jgi:hypothetical protein